MEQFDKPESTDDIVLETRRIKADLARSMDFDIDRILDDARRKQQESGRKVLAPPVPHDF